MLDSNLAIFGTTVLSAAVWLWLVLRYDKYEREPLRTVLRVGLIGGFLSGLCASVLNKVYILQANLDLHRYSLPAGDAAMFSLFVGLNEEFFKFLLTLKLIKRLKEFNEPIDAVIYGTAVALGFAFFENLDYAFEYGFLNVVVRSFTAVPLHLGLAAFWGVGIAKAHFIQGDKYFATSFPYLFTAAMLHAGYDFLCFTMDGGVLSSLAVSLLFAAGLFLYMRNRLRWLQQQSPLLGGVLCERCHAPQPSNARFCFQCGAPIEQEFYIVCPNCGYRSFRRDNFCARCGARYQDA